MRALAELSFQFIWHLLFAEEDVLDLDYAASWQETLPGYFQKMTPEEKQVLAQVASEYRDRLLAEPDEHGYTPRKLVSEDQRKFLDSLASGELFEEWFG